MVDIGMWFFFRAVHSFDIYKKYDSRKNITKHGFEKTHNDKLNFRWVGRTEI